MPEFPVAADDIMGHVVGLIEGRCQVVARPELAAVELIVKVASQDPPVMLLFGLRAVDLLMDRLADAGVAAARGADDQSPFCRHDL